VNLYRKARESEEERREYKKVKSNWGKLQERKKPKSEIIDPAFDCEMKESKISNELNEEFLLLLMR
jgi:hypothetical protein